MDTCVCVGTGLGVVCVMLVCMRMCDNVHGLCVEASGGQMVY